MSDSPSTRLHEEDVHAVPDRLEHPPELPGSLIAVPETDVVGGDLELPDDTRHLLHPGVLPHVLLPALVVPSRPTLLHAPPEDLAARGDLALKLADSALEVDELGVLLVLGGAPSLDIRVELADVLLSEVARVAAEGGEGLEGELVSTRHFKK